MYILPIIGVIGEDFRITDMLMHLNRAKNEQAIKLLINSPGGYTRDAEKMIELLNKSGKILYSQNTGDVASAAVGMFLTAPAENRIFDTSKGEFLIHMPFLSKDDGGVAGTSEEIQAAADEMRKLERSLAKMYAVKTGTPANILEGFMKENTPLTSEQIQSLGFATVVQPQTLKAVAYYTKSENMNQNEMNERLTGLEALMNKVVGLFKPKALMVKDTTGVEIDFGSEIQDESQITPGVKATIDGKPAEGNHVRADGSTLVFAAGELKEIMPPADETAEALKAENEKLKAEIEANKTAMATKDQEFMDFKASAEKEIGNVKTEILAIRNQFSGGTPGTVSNPPTTSVKTSGFTKDDMVKMFN